MRSSLRPALNRRLELATVRVRRRSWRRAGAAIVTRARATSQRRPPDRESRMRTPVTDCLARVPAGGGGGGGGGPEPVTTTVPPMLCGYEQWYGKDPVVVNC